MKRLALLGGGLAVAVAVAAVAYFRAAEEPQRIAAPSPPAVARKDPTRLVERPCGFTTESGREMTCYDFEVPERHGAEDSRTLTLPVIVFRAAESEKKPDPVVLISGGPGAISYTEARYAEIWRDKFKEYAWLKGRDLVVYDQRGVGGARPALECPEVDATRDHPGDVEKIKAAMTACRDRLKREGADLAAYDTAANVADLLALRRLLGRAEINLWGQSYGTRVALAALKRDASGIRSVILDGAYPPEVAGRLHFASTFIRTLDLVFAACAEDEECAADYPNLRQRFQRVVAMLREKPAVVASDPTPMLPAKSFQVDDIVFLSIVENLLYTADGIGRFPWVVERVLEGKHEALAEVLTDWDMVAYGPFVTTGVAFLVDCNDTPVADDSEDRAAAEKHPHLKRWIEHTLAVKPCAVWAPGRAPALDRGPVKAKVPTVILAGWYDLATPPSWAEIAHKSHGASQLILVRAAAHDAADHACAQSALEVFLNEPTRNLDGFCGPSPTAPPFKRKADED
jgi:pimeloyl-ACP methyl ester carboxylesterase